MLRARALCRRAVPLALPRVRALCEQPAAALARTSSVAKRRQARRCRERQANRHLCKGHAAMQLPVGRGAVVSSFAQRPLSQLVPLLDHP